MFIMLIYNYKHLWSLFLIQHLLSYYIIMFCRSFHIVFATVLLLVGAYSSLSGNRNRIGNGNGICVQNQKAWTAAY